MFYFPQINPIAVQLGVINIHWYGIAYLLGFFLAWMLGAIRCKAKGWSKQMLEDLLFYCIIGVILGGRLGYIIFYNLDYYWHFPTKIYAIWDGGMSFHGGFIGVMICLYFYQKKINKTFLQVTDFLVPLVPLGIALGRIGNLVNNELYGRVTNVPWAVIFPRDPSHLPRHPSQLYEAFLEGILLFILLWLFAKKNRSDGIVTVFFVIGYGIGRFIAEFYRQPDPQIGFIAFGWLTKGQELSLLMILTGIVMIIWIKYQQLNNCTIEKKTL